ncbi:uncharacterized protein LOC110984667 [Acanthaster planci]|uniref:WD repeat and coiled-coil-containing protein n=1 Tax=Acanthaster planci TaxID=133434 RepID=A0A8B7Z718_ACAPL|nr:uncharacterized protein LOC110984667 [Acanthaster planci]
MIIGNCKSRRINVNHLNGAYHPQHGLVWTDGQCVNLSIISVNHDDVIASPPTILGQFDSVEHAAWSSGTTPCYLSIQQVTCITVWKVDKCSQKLKFDKISEIEEQVIPQSCLWHQSKPLLVVLCRDQLLLVDPEKASTHAVHVNSCHRVTAGTWSLDGSQVIVAMGFDLCVYELSDDMQLVQARKIQNFAGPIRTVVPVAPDLAAIALDLPLEQLVSQSQVDMFEAIPLAELHVHAEGSNGDTQMIHSMASDTTQVVGQTKILHRLKDGKDQATESEILHRKGPVDINALIRRRDRNQMSGSNTAHQAAEGFVQSDHPPEQKTKHHSEREHGRNGSTVAVRLPTGEPHPGEVTRDVSLLESSSRNCLEEPNSGIQRRGGPQEVIDLSGLRHGLKHGVESTYRKLQFKRALQKPTSESSQLVLARVGNDAQEPAKDCILSAVELPCILSPDLLIYQESSQVLVVGSNTQAKCYQVSVLSGKSLGRLRLLDLDFSENERSLGLCTLPFNKDVLLLTGDSQVHDVTFLPSSSFSEYQLKLRTLKLHFHEPLEEEKCSGHDLDLTDDLPTLTLPNGRLLTGKEHPNKRVQAKLRRSHFHLTADLLLHKTNQSVAVSQCVRSNKLSPLSHIICKC